MSGPDGPFIRAKCEAPSRIILEAGAEQGIAVGSRMAIHASNILETAATTSNPCLGYLTVTTVHHYTSVLKVPPDTKPFWFPAVFYCLIEYLSSLRVALYCANGRWLETVFPPKNHDHDQFAITIVDDVEFCDLQLTVIDRKVYFDCHNVLVAPHIGTRMLHTVGVGDKTTIRNVVKGYLYFYHHLTQTGSVDCQDVEMELIKLKYQDEVYTPIENYPIADEPATIVVDDDTCFGIKIVNNGPQSLYPYLFDFDPEALVIFDNYMWRFEGKVDAPLPPKSTLMPGYGDGGIYRGSLWQYTIPEERKKYMVFYKLFLYTSPTDLSSIHQESPFSIGSSDARRPTVLTPKACATKLLTVKLIQKEGTH